MPTRRFFGIALGLACGWSALSPGEAAEPPLWIGVVMEGKALLPLARFETGSWTNPWPGRVYTEDVLDPQAPPSPRMATPVSWWGVGNGAEFDWTAWIDDGRIRRFRLDGSSSPIEDFRSFDWAANLGEPIEFGAAWKTDFAASQPIHLVRVVEVPEDSSDAKDLTEPIRAAAARLEQRRRQEIARAREHRWDTPCDPNPPLAGSATLAIEIFRSEVPISGRWIYWVEAWNRHPAADADRLHGYGAPETLTAWVEVCEGAPRWLAERLWFADQGCAEIDESLFTTAPPFGFLEIAGRLFVLRTLHQEVTWQQELLEIRDDRVEVVTRRGFGGD